MKYMLLFLALMLSNLAQAAIVTLSFSDTDVDSSASWELTFDNSNNDFVLSSNEFVSGNFSSTAFGINTNNIIDNVITAS